MANSAAAKNKTGKDSRAANKKPQVRENTPTQISRSGVRNVKPSVFPLELIAISLLVFVFLFFQEWSLKYDIQLVFFILAALIFIIFFFFYFNRHLLYNRMTPVLFVFLVQSLLYFAGLLYGTYTKFALQQFFLNMGGFFIFATLYVSFVRDKKNIEFFFGVFAVCLAAASLFCIELATSRYTFNIFQSFSKLINAQLPQGFGTFETNTRLTTVIGNANVYAPIALLASFAGLQRSGKPGSHIFKDAFFMGSALICGITFILCFSMGAILAYIPSIIAIFFITGKENRGLFLFKNLLWLIVSLVGAGLVFALRNKGVLPLLTVIAISALFSLAYVCIKPIKLPSLNIKSKRIAIAGIAGILIVLIILSLTLQGSYTLSKGSSFRRAVQLKPGTYKLALNTESSLPDSSVKVEIDSMSYAEAALKEKTVVTQAAVHPGDALEFTVPNASSAVFFNFTAETDLKIESAKVTGSNGTKALSLHYKILPEFIVNRMQGLWVNDNAIQRFIFFRDGIRLGMESPIIGNGGGAFEGALFGIADYKYMTKHVHNEYIQDFVDGGVIGLLLFIALTVFLIRALVKAKKSNRDSELYPLIFGCIIYIFLHSMVEVDFSMAAFRISALAFFAIASASYEEPFEKGRAVKISAVSLMSLLTAAAIFLSFGRMYAVDLTKASRVSLQALQQAATYDPFNDNDYKVSYLVATKDNPVVPAQAKEYLEYFENKKSLNKDTEYLLAYYYLVRKNPDIDKGVKLAERYLHDKRVDPDAWNSIFDIYETYMNTPAAKTINNDKIYESAKKLGNYLAELNASLPKEIKPELADYIYMQAMSAEKDKSKQSILDSRIPCDLNSDGISDLISSRGGDSVEWKLTAAFQNTGPYILNIYTKNTSTVEVLLDGNKVNSTYDAGKGCFTASLFSLDVKNRVLVIKSSQYSDKDYFTIEKPAN